MKAPPLYVKTLFEFLHTLGVTQQTVAKTLGVSKTTVSLWAHGKEPLSRRYVSVFLDLVADAAAAFANPLPDDHPRTLNAILTVSKTVQQHLHLWAMERQQTLGNVEQDYRQGCRVIASYMHQDPRKLDPEQWQAIEEARSKIGRARRLLAYLRQPPPPTNWPHAADLSRDGIRAALQEIADTGHLKAPEEAAGEEENDNA
jgi:hypothetical protein